MMIPRIRRLGPSRLRDEHQGATGSAVKEEVRKPNGLFTVRMEPGSQVFWSVLPLKTISLKSQNNKAVALINFPLTSLSWAGGGIVTRCSCRLGELQGKCRTVHSASTSVCSLVERTVSALHPHSARVTFLSHLVPC